MAFTLSKLSHRLAASRALGDSHSAEADQGDFAVGDQRDGVDGVGVCPARRSCDAQRARVHLVVGDGQEDFTLRVVDDGGNKVVGGNGGVGLHGGGEAHGDGAIADGAGGRAEVVSAGVAEGVDVGEVDDLRAVAGGRIFAELLGEGVAAAHRLGLHREQGFQLFRGETATELGKLGEIVALVLLGGRVRVGHLERLCAHNVFVIDFASSHAACAAAAAADPWKLSFHVCRVLSG